MARALENVRILDMSRVLAGPWATQLLGDLGAEVIKIERPGVGDDTRSWRPPVQKSQDNRHDEASYFLSANRNKKSVCIDISTEAGQDIIRELATSSDVFVENFKTGNLARYGLDAATLQLLNPRLLYCSITGFGQTGPYAKQPGYDLLIQAMGGLMSVTGVPDGEPGAGPMKVGVAMVDILTGLYAANAIQAALLHREHTGRGQVIDVALLDCLIAGMANQSQAYLSSRLNPERMGNAHPSIAPYDVYNTRDGHIILAVGNDGQFQELCLRIGLSELNSDRRFETNSERVRNRVDLKIILQKHLINQTTQHWLNCLKSSKVPAGPVNKISDIFADEHVQARGAQIELQHSTLGTINGVACPIKLNQTPPQYNAAPPVLGEHTNSVLSDILGYSPDKVRKLLDDNTVSNI